MTPDITTSREVKAPFAIRPHHLMLFGELIYDRDFKPALDPHELATLQNASIKKIRSIGEEYNHPPAIEYAVDVIGYTHEDAQRTLQRQTQVFEEFKLLQDYDRVDISLRPDRLCETCVVGRHCQTLNTGLDDDLNSVQAENLVLDIFLHGVKNVLGLGSTIREAHEEIIFSSGETYQARRIQTFAGTVKKFLYKTYPMSLSLDYIEHPPLPFRQA